MRNFAQIVFRKLIRDRNQPLRVIAEKAIEYAMASLLAPLYLRGANHVGERARAVGGPPRLINHGFMSIGDDTHIVSRIVRTELCTAEGAELIIGDSVFLNYGVSVGADRSVRIGNRVLLGPYVRVIDSDFYNRAVPSTPRPVVIEDDAWIGMHAVILPGVRVGRAAVVGTGSVVTKDVADYTVVVGVPARVVRQLDPSKFAIDVTGSGMDANDPLATVG